MGLIMRARKVFFKVVSFLLFLYMLVFTSCDAVDSCWVCENPYDSTDWQVVCNSMSKNKLESYGYICTQD